MMNYCTRGKEKSHAEVFTPGGLCFEMCLNPDLRDLFTNVDATVLDPAVGQGQFPCTELVLKMFCNVDKLDEDLALRALRSLYGIDIQESSITECKIHLLQTLRDAYKFFTGNDFTRFDEAFAIVNENMVVGDSMKIMAEWTTPQPSLF